MTILLNMCLCRANALSDNEFDNESNFAPFFNLSFFTLIDSAKNFDRFNLYKN